MSKLEMTKPIRDFVDHWFFDVFCKGEDCSSHDEFIDRVWKLYTYKNDADVTTCCKAANESGLIVYHTISDIRNFLANCATDVLFDLWESGDLPDCYAEIFEEDLVDQAVAE